MDDDPYHILSPDFDLFLSKKCCQYCRKIMDKPTKDHFIPKSKGGCNHRHNILRVCGPCNRRKGSDWPINWIKGNTKLMRKYKNALNCLEQREESK